MRKKNAMLVVYRDEVKRIEVRLRLMRRDIAQAGRITRYQYVERAKLTSQATLLYSMRRTARAYARHQASEPTTSRFPTPAVVTPLTPLP